MSRIAPGWLLLALVAGACGKSEDADAGDAAAGEARTPALWLRVEADVARVAFGRAFTLRVVRAWPNDLEPEAWSDAALAPLVVELRELDRRALGDGIVETRHYRAWAFAGDAVTLAPIEMRARPRDGGPLKSTRSRPWSVAVTSALPAGDARVAELPALPAPSAPPRRAVFLAAVLLGILAAWAWTRVRIPRRAAPAPAPAAAAPPLRGLVDELRQSWPEGEEARRAWVARAVDAARDALAAAHGVRARCMTSAELRSALQRLPAERARRAAWEELLERGDRAKFAHHRPDDDDRVSCLRALDEVGREGAER